MTFATWASELAIPSCCTLQCGRSVGEAAGFGAKDP